MCGDFVAGVQALYLNFFLVGGFGDEMRSSLL